MYFLDFITKLIFILFSFCEGDLLTEIQRVDNEWAWARLEKNGKSGLIAVQLTVPLVSLSSIHNNCSGMLLQTFFSKMERI